MIRTRSSGSTRFTQQKPGHIYGLETALDNLGHWTTKSWISCCATWKMSAKRDNQDEMPPRNCVAPNFDQSVGRTLIQQLSAATSARKGWFGIRRTKPPLLIRQIPSKERFGWGTSSPGSDLSLIGPNVILRNSARHMR
jgi:hypothetical protein